MQETQYLPMSAVVCYTNLSTIIIMNYSWSALVVAYSWMLEHSGTEASTLLIRWISFPKNEPDISLFLLTLAMYNRLGYIVKNPL